jgi:hypothetical protein
VAKFVVLYKIQQMKKLAFLIFFKLNIFQLLSSQTVHIAGPMGSSRFGDRLLVLPNGNYAVTDYQYTDGVTIGIGAVHLYDGATHNIISTFKGKYFNDRIGIEGLKLLAGTSNFLVISPFCNDGMAFGVGAETFINGTTGLNGEVNSSNSLMGSVNGDGIGSEGVYVLLNGDYVVRSKNCDNGSIINAGAFTLCNGSVGTSGIVSTSNSVMGGSDYDFVGSGIGSGNTANPILELPNGNIIYCSSLLNNGTIKEVGAVTFINRNTPYVGTINTANSLVGTKPQDFVGKYGCTILNNSNFVVSSIEWDNGSILDAGAATWVNGTVGLSGHITPANSLVGNNIGERVGEKSDNSSSLNGIYALPNGNYIVCTFKYNLGAGAATYCDGSTGRSGLINTSNSITGSIAGENISLGGIKILPNGNYLLISYSGRGAVTWCNGADGKTINNSGVISSSNSLIGTFSGDQVGQTVVVLPNNNYVVVSPFLRNGSIPNAGSVTLCRSDGFTIGNINIVNSFLGGSFDDRIGKDGIAVLANGNFVFGSSSWDNGATTDVGAVTFCKKDFTGTFSGIINSSNSLVGTNMSEKLGSNIREGNSTITNVYSPIIPLPNGNYIVQNDRFKNGMIEAAGAVVWCDGNTGRSGNIISTDALVGSSFADYIGSNGIVILSNSNYLVSSPNWDNGLKNNTGAITFCNGDGTTKGPINSTNSLIGNFNHTSVGSNSTGYFLSNSINNGSPKSFYEGFTNYHIQKLNNGDYILGGDAYQTQLNNTGYNYGNQSIGTVGYLTSCNSLTPPSQGSSASIYQYNSIYNYLIVSRPSENKISYFNPSISGASANITWLGSTNSNWSTPTNWPCGILPTPNANIMIPNIFPQPIVDINTEINKLTLSPGTNLQVLPGVTFKIKGM